MAIDITKIDQNNMEAVEEAILTLFKDSDIDTQEGSAARELIIRPMAAIQAWQRSEYDRLVESLDLNAIARGDIAGDDAIVDLLASTYRLTRGGGTGSAGTIILYLRNNLNTYINRSYSFYAGGNPLTVDRIIVGVEDTSAYESTEEVVYTPIRRLDGQYYMVVPVRDPSGGSFSTGYPVTFTGSADNINSAAVLSPITGGSVTETNKSLATRIMQGVAPGVLSTTTQIRGAFTEVFGIHPDKVRVFGSGSAAVRRAIDPFTLLPQPGYTDIVVSPPGGLAVDILDVTATHVSGGTYTITLSAVDAAGIYSIDSVTPSGVDLTAPALTVEWGVTSSVKHRIGDGRYTSYQTATLTFGADSTADTLDCSLMVRRARSIDALQIYIDDEVRRAPGQDMIVRGAVPCIVSMNIAVTAVTSSADVIRTALVEGINALPVGKGYIDAQDIIDALPDDVTLRFPMHLSGVFLLPNGQKSRSSTQGVLVAPDWTEEDGGITSEETAFFTDMDHIVVSVG